MLSRARVLILAGSCVSIVAGCGAPAPNQGSAFGDREVVAPGDVAAASKVLIPMLGDSLTAGYGLTSSEAFPALIQAMFTAEGYQEVEIINAGVSGDTTAAGLRRVESLLGANVRIMVVALGGNDALRGLSLKDSRENLAAIISQVRGADVDVMLTGMEGPTNLGEDYRSGFRAIFTGVAREFGREVTFVPFLLEGVAGLPELNQADGIHPNAQGAKIIAELLYPKLRDMVDRLPDATLFRTQ